MVCPLCHARKARRACPALGQQICAVCCGTKRVIEITCPSDCVYLASSKEHPPAVTKKRNERDLATLLSMVRDFSHAQSELFILLVTAISRYAAPELTPVVDEDVGEAAATLAATFETASRGVIYEHRTTSLNAGRLATALKAVLQQGGKSGGTPFERDAAVVLRQIEAGVRSTRAAEPDNPRAFLGLIDRTMRKTDPAAEMSPEASSRLIVP